MQMRAEDRALHGAARALRQQQIGNSLQPISGRRMPGNLHAQATQLLDKPPNFGAAGPDFFRQFGPADHDGGVIHEQPNDPSQTKIRLLRRGGLCAVDVWRGRPRPRST